MTKQSYHSLITEIHEQQHELQDVTRQTHALEHQLNEQKKLAAKRLMHLRTLQTLNLGIFSALGVDDIYQLTCQTVVHQLQWDTAFVVSFKGNRGVVTTSYQATKKQLEHLHDYLSTAGAFTEAYTQRHAISTYHSHDKAALSLRALFSTDEVVAMPIQFGEQLYGYLVACSHSHEEQQYSQEDIDFLSVLAVQIGHAVQNSANFASLEAQNIKLRELDELKDSFISITSHQLRTPLSIIKWILSVLQSDKKLEPLTEQMKLIDQAYISNERLIHVVNDLLNVSRIQEGKLPYNPQLADSAVMLRDLCVGTEKLAQTKGLTMEYKFEEKIPLLPLDSILFKEALQNLLDNAVDYSDASGVIKVTLKKSGSEVIITIKNTGRGISKEEMPKIFNQFYRSPEAIIQQPNGNGLGLYLTRAIVEQHGGEITCESDPGKETIFTITLPIPKESKSHA